jgi:hypothetical protein
MYANLTSSVPIRSAGATPRHFSQSSQYDTGRAKSNQPTKRPTLHRPNNPRRKGRIRPKLRHPRPILPKTTLGKPPFPRSPPRLSQRLQPPIPHRPNLAPRTRPHRLEILTIPIHGTANQAILMPYASRSLHAEKPTPLVKLWNLQHRLSGRFNSLVKKLQSAVLIVADALVGVPLGEPINSPPPYSKPNLTPPPDPIFFQIHTRPRGCTIPS